MKSNVVKILSIVLIALIIFGISNSVFAGSLTQSITVKDSTTGNKIGNIGGMIVNILQVIGVAAAIIMLVFLGIKYVSAAPSEKADIKKSAAIYVVGAVMLLGASFILGLIGGFVGDLEGTPPSQQQPSQSPSLQQQQTTPSLRS